jgi:hypothetical protein
MAGAGGAVDESHGAEALEDQDDLVEQAPRIDPLFELGVDRPGNAGPQRSNGLPANQ